MQPRRAVPWNTASLCWHRVAVAEPPPEGVTSRHLSDGVYNGVGIPSISAKVVSTWNTGGPDTVHLTFKEGPHRTPVELSQLLGEFQAMHDLPSSPVGRDRGVQGFGSAAVDEAAGLRLDWTRPGQEGNNPGFFCIQVKGTWFENADGETAADFLQLLQAYGPYRCTRIDFQQTTRTRDHLTPWWIAEFETGRMRVIGRKHFEPRGSKNADGDYPEGATLYHGSRKSERFARQYDKHLESNYGPPRRRDEVEIKGETARNSWQKLHDELLACEQLGTSRGATLHSFSKGAIRAFLPIRDTSAWAGKELPPKWTSMAPEPTSWSTLFDDDPIAVKPRERRVSGFLKSYRYATDNFGAAIAVRAIERATELQQEREWDAPRAWARAWSDIGMDFARGANPDRVRDFLSELNPSIALPAHEAYLSLIECIKDHDEMVSDHEDADEPGEYSRKFSRM